MRPLASKYPALATVLMLSGCATAHAQQAPASVTPEKPISITLTTSQWNIVLQGLSELPVKVALNLITEIQNQATAALKPPDAKEKH